MNKNDIIHNMNAIRSLLDGTAHLLREFVPTEKAWLLENITHSADRLEGLRDSWVETREALDYREDEEGIVHDAP